MLPTAATTVTRPTGIPHRCRGAKADVTLPPAAPATLANGSAAEPPAAALAEPDGASGATDDAADVADDEAEDDVLLAAGPLVVREKAHDATPMSLDDALHQMELVGHDFYLFADADSGLPSVVYRRRGYTYGVLRLRATPG